MNHFDELDLAKLVEQDDKFEQYVKDVMFKNIMLDRKNRAGILGFLFTYYQMNMDTDHVSEILTNMRKYQG